MIFVAAGLTAFLLLMFGLYKFFQYGEKYEGTVRKKYKFLYKYSEKFKRLVNENNMIYFRNKTLASTEDINIDKVNKIIKLIEDDPVEQVRIQHAMDREKNFNIQNPVINYAAYSHIKVIRILKSLKEPYSKQNICATISEAYPDTSFRKIFHTLRKAGVIERAKGFFKYRLNPGLNEIYHPYKTDEFGDPLKVL